MTPIILVIEQLTTTVARAVLLLVSFLIGWSILPTALGFGSLVVMTGSMQPAIDPGDVIVTQRIAYSELRPGQILLVNDPNRVNGLLSHRLQSIDADGSLVLKGDANNEADSTVIEEDDYRGVARLIVPTVGSPKVWIATQQYEKVALAAVFIAMASLLALRQDRPPPRHAASRAN